jgi:hypothetical protein
VSRVCHRLRSLGEREVSSRNVGEFVMEELRHLDEVAYVRFASVYRSFQDVEAFREEIEHCAAAAVGIRSPASCRCCRARPLPPGRCAAVAARLQWIHRLSPPPTLTRAQSNGRRFLDV